MNCNYKSELIYKNLYLKINTNVLEIVKFVCLPLKSQVSIFYFTLYNNNNFL